MKKLNHMRRQQAVGLIVAALCLGGCAGGGFLANAVGGGTKKVQVEARYLGLDGKSVAVLVAANSYILHQQPDADQSVCVAVTNRLAAALPTVTVTAPARIGDFQRKNPYWTTMTYRELAEQLAVERVVLIDLSEYRTHEPGNAHVWQGYVAASVGVIEAEHADSDTMAFREEVSARFPDHELGMLDSDEQTIQTGMLVFFSRDAAGLFYDHEIEVEQ